MYVAHRTIEKGSPELIRYVREHLGLSQSNFARQLGVALHTVSRWETGTIKPPLIAQLAASYLFEQHNKSRSVGSTGEEI